MVKTRGPLQSLSASGSIGDAVTYSNWKGRHYTKTKSLPKDPRTDQQTAGRFMMGWLSKQWNQLTADQQATWGLQPGKTRIPEYNHFLEVNLKRLTANLAPTQAWPATEAGTPPTWLAPTLPGNGIVHALLCLPFFTVPADAWGLAIYLSTDAACLPINTNLAALQRLTVAWFGLVTITPLAPMKYYYRARAFTNDGKWGDPLNVTWRIVLDYS